MDMKNVIDFFDFHLGRAKNLFIYVEQFKCQKFHENGSEGGLQPISPFCLTSWSESNRMKGRLLFIRGFISIK
jgi:hypothetical protein